MVNVTVSYATVPWFESPAPGTLLNLSFLFVITLSSFYCYLFILLCFFIYHQFL